MIRLIAGLIIVASAADAPADAPLPIIIIAGLAGLIIAASGARKLARS
jgi:hypothetical protein